MVNNYCTSVLGVALEPVLAAVILLTQTDLGHHDHALNAQDLWKGNNKYDDATGQHGQAGLSVATSVLIVFKHSRILFFLF